MKVKTSHKGSVKLGYFFLDPFLYFNPESFIYNIHTSVIKSTNVYFQSNLTTPQVILYFIAKKKGLTQVLIDHLKLWNMNTSLYSDFVVSWVVLR
jgi:hypothetical protein